MSRLPAGYSTWQKLNLFRHGAMQKAGYALDVFKQHFARSGLIAGQPFVALEIGPGDSLSSAVVAAAHGATHTYLVDAGAFATSDMAVYREISAKLCAAGLNAPDLSAVQNVPDLLRTCRASYLTRGLVSMRELPSAEVDFIWSQAVLEHVRRAEFVEFIRETRRVLKPSGLASHVIDLQDHLGGALNNLRIGSRLWETQWMANSGFYTNRLSEPEIISAFESAQFAVERVSELRWQDLPTLVKAFAPEFREAHLAARYVKVFDILAKPYER
ncbi:MAG: class I SAM-dependent methyltransferase [Pseudomonadota bacterium]